ncbi:MAG: hypothetical protein HAW61_02480 [Candidatus Portiera sp.]|nr:hypothetical protein [Portiera sp.]
MKKIITILLLFPVFANAAGKWDLTCYKDELTEEIKISGASPAAEVVINPGKPYDNMVTVLFMNILPDGNLQVGISASSINLVGGEHRNVYDLIKFDTYNLQGKFSPSDKLETYQVSHMQTSPNHLFFSAEKTYNLILNNDSLLIDLPYYTGKGRFRYSWDKEDLANKISSLKKTCFTKWYL